MGRTVHEPDSQRPLFYGVDGGEYLGRLTEGDVLGLKPVSDGFVGEHPSGRAHSELGGVERLGSEHDPHLRARGLVVPTGNQVDHLGDRGEAGHQERVSGGRQVSP